MDEISSCTVGRQSSSSSSRLLGLAPLAQVLDLALELADAAHQAGERLGDRVGQAGVLDIGAVDVAGHALAVNDHGTAGVADDGRVRRGRP